MSEEMKTLVEEVKKEFHEFKASNEQREKELKKNLGIAEIEEKQDRLTESITQLMEKSQKLDAIANAEVKVESNSNAIEAKHSEAFINYVTKGDESLFESAELKTMNVQSDPDGGFLVSPNVSNQIHTRIYETSPIRQYANVISIGSDSHEFMAMYERIAHGGWVSEQDSRETTGTQQFKKRRIDIHEHYAQPQVTQKTLDDAFLNIESFLAEEIAKEFAMQEASVFLNGNGVGKPRGILTYTGWSSAGTFEADKVEQVNSGSNGAFTADGLMDIQNSLLEDYQNNAVWMLKRQSFKEIIQLKDSENNYLFNRSLDRNTGQAFDLLGRPVVFASDMPAVGSNALALVYGDFSRGYQIVDRVGIRTIRDIYTAKPFIKFYTTKRVGGDVHDFAALKIQKLAV